MSTLAKLKLVSSKPLRNISPVVARRNKLSTKLWEQLQLAEAQKDGRLFAPTRLRTFTNSDTGERKTLEVPKRLKNWWWTNEQGVLTLAVRYGAKQLELAKGKNAVELASKDELIAALKALKAAVEAGELDTQIESAANSVRSRFAK